jgi:hypothetical protein
MNATLSASLGATPTARAAAPRPLTRGVASTPVVAAPRVGGGRSAAPHSGAVRVSAAAVRDGAKLDRKLRVAVIGGGPSGACAAETLAAGGVETFLIERKLDNCKVRVEERSFLFAFVGGDGGGGRGGALVVREGTPPWPSAHPPDYLALLYS